MVSPKEFRAMTMPLKTILCVLLLANVLLAEHIHSRHIRQAGGTSVLTVQWEGIQTKVADNVIKGFRVEYRPESEMNWIEHAGLIPYRGPFYLYRVTIKDLPSGVAYMVRIKVISVDNEVLVETAEIRAETTTLSIDCSSGEISEPLRVSIKEEQESSLVFEWSPPECADADIQYECRLQGVSTYADFDMHTMTVDGTTVRMSNLLPGTTYSFQVRGVDRARRTKGPWSGQQIESSTDGAAPVISRKVDSVYQSNTELRVKWQLLKELNVQHYEVMIMERTAGRDSEGMQVSRMQVPPTQNSYLFTNLKENQAYMVGIIAFVDNSPRVVFKTDMSTSMMTTQSWSMSPAIEAVPGGGRGGQEDIHVSWNTPRQYAQQDLHSFIVEFKLPNESDWRTYGDPIEVVAGRNTYHVTLQDVDDNIYYELRVFVINTRGETIAKSRQFKVGKGAMMSCAGKAGSPANVALEYVGQTSITLRWDRPSCNEAYGPIEAYEYVYFDTRRENSDSRKPVVVASGTKVTINRLRPSTSYTVLIRSRSREGVSDWSKEMVTKTAVGQSQTVNHPDGQGVVDDRKNMYNLRVILASQRSYLAWTPLEGDVRRVRLSYKETAKERMTTIEEMAAFFKCPPKIAQDHDLCFDLTDLQRGIQYTSEVVYERGDGTWADMAQPLFFILVEADKPNIPVAPAGLEVILQSATVARLKWLPPLYDATAVDNYKVVAQTLRGGDVPGAQTFRVAGNVYTHTITGLVAGAVYNVSVAAGTRQGFTGPAAWQVVNTDRDMGPTVEHAQVTQRGDQITVQWDANGHLNGLCCFQLEVREQSAREWRDFGSLVPLIATQRRYETTLTGLSGNEQYYIRILILNRSRQEVHSSDAINVITQCQPPLLPPTNISIVAENSRSIFFTWTPPPQTTWNCVNVLYVIEGSVDGKPFSKEVRTDERAFRVEHREVALPASEWIVHVATKNSGGQSPWSQQFGITAAAETLIANPLVTPQGSDLLVEWQSDGEAPGVDGYRVEIRTSDNARWTTYGNIVPHAGKQRYSSTLTRLISGATYHIRIQVLDRTQRVIFTSPEAIATTTCRPAISSPSNLRVDSPDPSHVRITWQAPTNAAWNCNEAQVELEVIQPSGKQPIRLPATQTSHVIQSTSNEEWIIRVRLVNSAGSGPWSQSVTGQTSAPQEYVINIRITHARETAILHWESIRIVQEALISHYEVEYSVDGRTWRTHRNSRIPFIGSHAPYQQTLSDLAAGQTAYVRVRVVDYNNGHLYTSSSQSVHMPLACRPPTSPPTNLLVSAAGDRSVRVSWRPIAQNEWNCESVWFMMKYSSATTNGFKNFTSAQFEHVFDSQPATQWTISMQTVNNAGSSSWTRMETGSTLQGTPGSPINVRYFQLGPSVVQITWSPPDQSNGRIQSYELTYQLVDRGMCRGSPGQRMTINVADGKTSHQLEALHAHSKYIVTVRAKTNVAGEPVEVEVLTDNTMPKAPPRTVTAVSSSPSSVDLQWQAPACLDTNGDISEYEYECVGDSPWARGEKQSGSTQDSRVHIDGLTPFTSYNCRARAYTTKGPGPWSAVHTILTMSSKTGSVPSMLHIIDTSAESVQLMWQQPYPPHGPIDNYRIRYTVGGIGDWRVVEAVPSRSRCQPHVLASRGFTDRTKKYYCITVEGLESEQMYDLQVGVHMSAGSWGAYGPVESARTSSGPVTITSVEKTGGSDKDLTLKWAVKPADMSRVSAFRIITYPMAQKGRIVEYTVDGNTYDYRLENLDANTEYNVSVQAKTRGGYHEGTSRVMTTEELSIPSIQHAPTIISSQPNSLTVEWREPHDSRGITEYYLEFRTNPQSAWSRHPVAIPNRPGMQRFQAELPDLEPNSAVDVRVFGQSGDHRGAPSPHVQGRTSCARPTQAPQGLRVDAPTQTQVRVTWTRPNHQLWNCDHIDYELWYQVEGQAERIIPITGEQTEYSVDSNAHTTWYFKIRAKNSMGASEWSAVQQITTQQDRPGNVRNLILDAHGANSIYAAWLEPEVTKGNVAGYDVSYRLKMRVACPEEEPRDASRDWITVYHHKQNEYKITGLLPNSEYEVRVQARTTELGPATSQTIRTHSSPPSASPLDLKLTYTLERSVSISWQSVECSQRHGDITAYEFELLGLDNWAKFERQISNTSDLQTTIEGLTPFTKYMIRVKAYNQVGAGPNTENLEIQTAKAEAPLAPQDLYVVQEGTHFFAVSWVAPYPPYGPLDSYKLRYRQVTFGRNDDWTVVEHRKNDPMFDCSRYEDVEIFRQCYNVSNQQPGQQYRVQVAAKIAEGTYGQWCEVVTANTLEIVPGAPRSISLIGKSDSSLHLRWEPPVDMADRVTQYKLHIRPCEENGGDAKQYTVDDSITEYLFDGLEAEKCYNVTIQAGTSRGFGNGRETQQHTDNYVIPRINTRPTVSALGSQTLNVEWPAARDPKNRIFGYAIEYKGMTGGAWERLDRIVQHVSVKQRYYEKITGLTANTDYQVRIRVVDGKQREGDPSEVATARTGCGKPTASPSDIQLTAPTPSDIRIVWQAPAQTTWHCASITYTLQYRNGTTSTWSSVTKQGGETEQRFESQPYNKWSVRMQTVNVAGESDWSDEVSITTPEDAPSVVTTVNGKPTGPTSISVDWTTPEKENGKLLGYTVIYRLKSNGDCAVPPGAPVAKEVRSNRIDLTDLQPDSTYEIIVKARTSKEGPPSNAVLITTFEEKPTGTVSRLRAATLNPTSATFDWQPPECRERNGEISAYEYEVEGIDDWVKEEGTKKATVNRERADVNDLVPYTTYKIRVRASNSEGSGPFTEWLEFRTRPGAPPAPLSLKEEEAQPTSIRISFQAPSPPHGELDEYKIRYRTTLLSGNVQWIEKRVKPEQLRCSTGGNIGRLCYRAGGMQPDTDYTIEVSAHTHDGDYGAWTQPGLESRTTEMDIPILENPLRVVKQYPEAVDIEFEGLDPREEPNVAAYQLETNNGDGVWKPFGEPIRANRPGEGLTHKVTVDGLEPDEEYFIRAKVVSKNGKQGEAGPELTAQTNCGKPERPPHSIALADEDYKTLIVTFSEPPSSTWSCADVIYVIEYNNGTHQGEVIVDEDEKEYEFVTMPGTEWDIRMATRADDGEEGTDGPQSEWSPMAEHTVQMPDNLFVKVDAESPTELIGSWKFPDAGEWPYGADVTYVLKQLGNCPVGETDHKPVTKSNVKNGKVSLTGLEPYSLYEITVQPKVAAGSSVKATKTTESGRTAEMKPDGPPLNVHNIEVTRDMLQFKWEPPACEKQRGEITQYEYNIVGLDDWVKDIDLKAVSARDRATMNGLHPGTNYRFKVRAYTSVGAGPWSDTINMRTSGSEISAPMSLRTTGTGARHIGLQWFPPSPLRGAITGYRLSYSTKAEEQTPKVVDISGEDLDCARGRDAEHNEEARCYKLTGLTPVTTYVIKVQAKAESGNWGDWSHAIYATTNDKPGPLGGALKLLSRTNKALKVQWTPPNPVSEEISNYLVSISVASTKPQKVPIHNVSATQREHQFKGLEAVTAYNVTVEGQRGGQQIWFISKIFRTLDTMTGPLHWLGAPENLRLLEKDHQMMHVEWDPPEIMHPADRKLLRHYRVTIAPYDSYSDTTGTSKKYSVPLPGTRMRFDNLDPRTVYNITVEACTSSGCGLQLWGDYSTLPRGDNHILRLVYRTPTSLRVKWKSIWGQNTGGYTLTAHPLHSLTPGADLDTPIVRKASGDDVAFTIRGLTPSTIYNVTLQPVRASGGAWGAYNTLPPGAMVVRNLKACNTTDFAISFNWEPLLGDVEQLGTHYRVRYAKGSDLFDREWIELPEQTKAQMRCPGDPCNKLCAVVYNLADADDYTIQVAAKVDGEWNRYKSMQHGANRYDGDAHEMKACCIVPPYYHLDTIGEPGTMQEIIIKPVPNATHVLRYYVVVDERSGRGDINATLLTDKLTAKRLNIPYYIAGSFDNATLTSERKFPVGDAKTYGGYINYPLEKGKSYTFPFVTVWWVNDKPIVGWWRDNSQLTVAGWPWWWLLLLLLLLLLLILCYCCFFWCFASRYRRRHQRRIITNGSTTTPLLGTMDSKTHMSGDLKALESRIDNIRTQLDGRGDMVNGVRSTRSRDGDISGSDDGDNFDRRSRRSRRSAQNNYYNTSKGDFEDGYVRGFRDSNKVGGASDARRRMDGEYGAKDKYWQSGYASGLRDAGMTGMTHSMHNLANREKTSGYGSGYTQGFRDGNSGIFGDRITNTLLHRLEEQYPTQDDFRHGYVDGFKEGVGTRTIISDKTDTRLKENIEHISERLHTLERTKGDEIHSTKIYHVYNTPNGQQLSSDGQALAGELNEMSESRRSMMRTHYTSGDYMRYGFSGAGSDTEGYGAGSLKKSKRSLSATALGRDDYSTPRRVPPGPMHNTSTLRSQASNYQSDTMNTNSNSINRRYNYRSRSDLGQTTPRRYASQTLLDGSRPGPTTPHTWRRDALENLQKELDTLSRSPVGTATSRSGNVTSTTAVHHHRRDLMSELGSRGYSSDTNYGGGAQGEYETRYIRNSRTPTMSPPNVPTRYSSSYNRARAYMSSPSGTEASSTVGGVALKEVYSLVGVPRGAASGTSTLNTTAPTTTNTTATTAGQQAQQQLVAGHSSGSRQWPDDLIDIVHEPMGQTLERMKKYSNSVGRVDQPLDDDEMASAHQTSGGAGKESYSESYSHTQKEEYSMQPGQ